MPLLEHYRTCVLAGLQEGVPKREFQKKFKRFSTNQRKTALNLGEEFIRLYKDADPEGPENTRKVNANLMGQTAPGIRRKS